MRYPDLVPDWICKTPIVLTIYSEELDEDGAPVVAANITANCNYQDGGKALYTADHHRIEISGRAYLNGDVFPGLTHITGGQAAIFGELRDVLEARKSRNPDGTVNFTEVILR